MKRPAFQFYPADWRKDVELQSCSMAAQGLWINIMCLAHECEPYGHLTINGKAMTPAQLGRQVGLSAKECECLLDELVDAGVARKTEEGLIYSKRMVDDERLRNVRAESGRLGGNPSLVGKKVKQEVNQTSNQDDKQKPTPSSSSSSSSSTSVDTSPNGDGGQSAAADVADPCPHQAIIDLYHRHLPTGRHVREWTPARAQSLRARWREKPSRQKLEWWDRFFAYCAESDFLTGKVNTPGRKPFELSLDWLVKAENMAKVIEGAYENVREAA